MKFINTVGILTSLKIPEKILKRQFAGNMAYSSLLPYFPLVGLMIGTIGFIVFFAMNLIFPLVLTVSAVIIYEILITGGLHLDGLADTFDGFFSKETAKEKIIEVMKKSNIGVFGVIALLIVISLKAVLIYLISSELSIPVIFNGFKNNFSESGNYLPNFFVIFVILVFLPLFGRLSMLYLFASYDTAVKENSLALAFKHESNRKIFISQTVLYSLLFVAANTISKFYFFKEGLLYSGSATGLSHSIVLSLVIIIVESILIILIFFIFVFFTSKLFTVKIGGISGDILGAVSVMSEIYFLFFNYFFLLISRYYIRIPV